MGTCTPWAEKISKRPVAGFYPAVLPKMAACLKKSKRQVDINKWIINNLDCAGNGGGGEWHRGKEPRCVYCVATDGTAVPTSHLLGGAPTPIREGECDLANNQRAGPRDSDTFVVNVQFRQNASWQGTVKWAGQNQEVYFRSTLELLKIMDSVLADNHPEDEEARGFTR